MSHDKIGPKEMQRRLMREENYMAAQGKLKSSKKPSTSELRKKIAAVVPKAKKQGGRRGR